MQPESGFSTRAVHTGSEADPVTGAVITPVYATSTFKQDGVGGLRNGYEYSRSANPTRTAWEECLAALENGRHGFAFASGLAAEDTLIRALLKPGDHVVIPNDAYGGTFRLFDKVAARWGVEYTAVPIDDPGALLAACTSATKLVWIETPTNPLLTIADITEITTALADHDLHVAVDNTFATPYLQQPLDLGADIVVHSTTKYVNGHSDTVGGAIAVNDDDLAERIRFHQNSMGAVMGPFDAWLTHRGAKTLSVRMERHCDTAERIAAYLSSHPKVAQVYYPGLESHPSHAVAAKQMSRFGGMVSFRHKDGEEASVEMCNRAKLFTLAESLGGVESLIEHPARMTHASAEGSELEVPSDLVRLSVGIEDAEDLLADLEQALD
ncbi:cystathionine gamma-synthase [Salininema proteolyticum]|uniref:Cystathionine gamma-synthase n=1 Tax=Salininema proteolyticum TaxID=1607685 RepID=A0ABV8TU46_9ACTN